MELKRRKIRRGAKLYLEPTHSGRPSKIGRYGGGLSLDDDSDIDQTPCKPFSRDDFMAGLNLGELPAPRAPVTFNPAPPDYDWSKFDDVPIDPPAPVIPCPEIPASLFSRNRR